VTTTAKKGEQGDMTAAQMRQSIGWGGIAGIITIVLSVGGLGVAAGAALNTGSNNKEAIAEASQCNRAAIKEARDEAATARRRIEEETKAAAELGAELTRKFAYFEGEMSAKMDGMAQRVDMIYSVVSRFEPVTE
jgi:hypothetical protein